MDDYDGRSEDGICDIKLAGNIQHVNIWLHINQKKIQYSI